MYIEKYERNNNKNKIPRGGLVRGGPLSAHAPYYTHIPFYQFQNMFFPSCFIRNDMLYVPWSKPRSRINPHRYIYTHFMLGAPQSISHTPKSQVNAPCPIVQFLLSIAHNHSSCFMPHAICPMLHAPTSGPYPSVQVGHNKT